MTINKFGKTRRDFLIKSAAVIPAMAVGGIALQAMAAPSSPGTERADKAASRDWSASDYKPTFFNQEEFEFVKASVSRLIPKDHSGPGALEAGVPAFIDLQMQTPYGTGANWYMQGPFHPDANPLFGYQLPLTPRNVYRLGIAEANGFARKKFGNIFHELPDGQQDALLEMMESGKASFTKLPSKVFFAALLQNTREGFFSDPIHGGNQGMVGWKLIGFPGARADFMDWVERGEKYPFPPVSINGERR